MSEVVHKRLEFVEPVATCDILAGYFTYCEKDGTKVEAEFFVRCCSMDDNSISARGEREDALNEQYMDQFMALQQSGCTDITYKQALPNPFF